MGIRTNGVLALQRPEIIKLDDKGSITVCSLNPDIYIKMMGKGTPPNIEKIKRLTEESGWSDLKANIVLGPENIDGDWLSTVKTLAQYGFKKINLREPYGQPHIGNPIKTTLGMPTYDIDGCQVTYWDVHYVEVESVNLYANGIVSETYPITQGHHPTGSVKDQSNFSGGRVQDQWLTLRKGKHAS